MPRADPWRLFHIGDFFTDLALKIFGGEKTASSQDSGDIDNWELDIQIEVKGCSNRNSLKIYSNQLDEETANLGFPFGRLWYAIFFYRNQWRNTSRSLSKETPTRKAMDDFLCENIMSAFVIDSKALTAIRKANGLKEERRAGEIAYAIRMNKGTLHLFTDNPGHALKYFKLRGFGVLKQRICQKFRGSSVNFELALILPNKDLRRVFQLNFHFPEASESQDEPLLS